VPEIHVWALIFYHGFFFLFIRPLVSELAERRSAISGYIVGTNCDLKMHVRNVGYPFPLEIGRPKTPFSMIAQLNTFNGMYLRNETRYTQAGKCIANYKVSQNNMNFGPHTASNWRWIFTHTPQILHSTSLPGFADGDQQTELNQTLPNDDSVNHANNLP